MLGNVIAGKGVMRAGKFVLRIGTQSNTYYKSKNLVPLHALSNIEIT